MRHLNVAVLREPLPEHLCLSFQDIPREYSLLLLYPLLLFKESSFEFWPFALVVSLRS